MKQANPDAVPLPRLHRWLDPQYHTFVSAPHVEDVHHALSSIDSSRTTVDFTLLRMSMSVIARSVVRTVVQDIQIAADSS